MFSFSPMLAVSTLLAYLIGALPFGYLFVRYSMGKDVRTMGSGNIGATNVQRSAGSKAGFIVLLLDIAKGFFALWLAAYITHNDPLAMALAILAVMLGHCFPVFLNFHGGKAVACYIGAFIYVAPLTLLATAIVFFAVVGLTKYVSLGSLIGAAVLPLLLWWISRPPEPILAASIFAALLIIYRHRGNIDRLRTGKENVFSMKGGAARS